MPNEATFRAWDQKLPNVSQGTAIPKIIHQIYAQFSAVSESRIPNCGSGPSTSPRAPPSLPEPLEKNVTRIKSLNPTWEHRLYDQAEITDFVHSNYGPDVLAQYERIDPRYGAARADLFRYLLIYRVGGVYLDIKSTFFKPLDQVLLPDDVYVLSRWKGAQFKTWGNHRILQPFGGKEFQQWHVIAAAGHPFLRAVIIRVLSHLDTYNPLFHATGRMGVNWSTGPIAYTLAIAPLLSQHRHRLVGGQDELGLEYTIFGEPDRAHKSVFRHHYTELDQPVVHLKGARRLAWAVLGPIQIHVVYRLQRLHGAIARRISRLWP